METSIQSTTLFDRLPTEIIFIIFDYLSSNDIVYTFFFFNQRFNYLLLQNEHYFNYLELPITNLNRWKSILSIIGSQIECLNIFHLFLPFTYFPNLKSIIISFPYTLPEHALRSILESEQFQSLHSFKIKEQKTVSSKLCNDKLNTEYNIFKRIFNKKSSLKLFQCSMIRSDFTLRDISSFETNFNLHSLILKLTNLTEIFSFISYTPNLKYLNVQSKQCSRNQLSLNKFDIKLEEFYVTLKIKDSIETDSDQLNNLINMFSSSLICLSLNLVYLFGTNENDFPFNSNRLQQLLESMIELKQFHFYGEGYNYRVSNDFILSQFQNQFWFDRNLSFGIHDNYLYRYLYTLTFHFNHLYLSYNGFDNIKSTNRSILINNRRIWYNVKSIELPMTFKYNKVFIKKLQMKMPKLTSIKFDGNMILPETQETSTTNDETEDIDFTSDNVSSIEVFKGNIKNHKDWIIYSLPNLRNLILDFSNFPSIRNELCPILNKRIERLDIYSDYDFKQLTKSYVYFSNVEHINLKILL